MYMRSDDAKKSVTKPFVLLHGVRRVAMSSTLVLVLLISFSLLTSACGSTRPTKRSATGRKYKPLKCPCREASLPLETEQFTNQRYDESLVAE